MSKPRKNSNWASVAVNLSEDDTVYLISIINADITAMATYPGTMATYPGKWAIPMQRALRTRQKLQDALRNRRREHAKSIDRNQAVAVRTEV